MRVAALDIGTNTVLLLIAEAAAGRPLRAIEERAEITRLGQGVDRSRRLAPEAIDRTCRCLDVYADVVRRAGVDLVGVVGTSAMRDASGGEVVRAHVRAAFGVDARVISGEEEARLTFHGAVSGLNLPAGERTAVFDIGGGSTEVVLGRIGGVPPISFARSFDVGSVRLTERHISHDPPTPEELAAITQAAANSFAGVPPADTDGLPVGVAGTMTTLASVSLALVPYDGTRVHGHVMTRAELTQVIDRLSALDLTTRRAIPGIEPRRADVLVAGGLVALALLNRWNASAVRISDRGVRWGLAEELAGGRDGGGLSSVT
jgi:exopolyphosphatase/guanosine-5'-triphosphate,3'-diphosphate pyrophosphatase